jgi:hypothetical protein
MAVYVDQLTILPHAAGQPRTGARKSAKSVSYAGRMKAKLPWLAAAFLGFLGVLAYAQNSQQSNNSAARFQLFMGEREMGIVYKTIGWFEEYARNPRKNHAVVDRMCASILEYGFAIPMLCRSNGGIVDGDLEL